MKPFCYWIPAGLMALALFVSSALPPVLPAPAEPGSILSPLDKWAHLAAYGLLAGLILWALRRGHNLRLPTTAALAILLAAGYGAFDEWHQSFVPSRCASLADWLADLLGAVLVTALWWTYESCRRRKTHC